MIKSLYNVMEIRGVKVYAHWSVLLIGAIVLMGAVSDPSTAIPGLLCYYSVILLHECGHMIVAQRKGYPVWSIEIYPIWGIARFSEPYSHYDRCVIAWGGVLAQLLVALPVIIVSEFLGATKYASLNTVFGMFGFFSLFVAAFNLIPAPPSDGSIAWGSCQFSSKGIFEVALLNAQRVGNLDSSTWLGPDKRRNRTSALAQYSTCPVTRLIGTWSTVKYFRKLYSWCSLNDFAREYVAEKSLAACESGCVPTLA